MMGPQAAANAVLGASERFVSVFPAVGRVLRVTVDGAAVTGVAVVVDGETFLCRWSGVFALEVAAVGAPNVVGQDVKVELVAGVLVAAYTVQGRI